MITAEPSTLHGPSSIACPECGQGDRVDKASSIVRQNTGLVYVAGAYEPFSTLIANQLAAPESPKPPSWRALITKLVACLALTVVAAALAHLFGENEWWPSQADVAIKGLMITFGLLIPGLVLYHFVKNYRSMPQACSAWSMAMSRWNNLYYCSRDDIGFLTGSEMLMAPESIASLLYEAVTAAEELPSSVLKPELALPSI